MVDFQFKETSNKEILDKRFEIFKNSLLRIEDIENKLNKIKNNNEDCVNDKYKEINCSHNKMTVNQSVYRENIINKIDKQIQKGIDKYGTTLEQNDWFKAIDRITYLQEELIDALVYSEHIIARLKELNIDLD